MARPPFLALGRTSIRVFVELESIADFSCHPLSRHLSRHGQKSSDTSVALPAKQEPPSCLAECAVLNGRACCHGRRETETTIKAARSNRYPISGEICQAQMGRRLWLHADVDHHVLSNAEAITGVLGMLGLED